MIHAPRSPSVWAGTLASCAWSRGNAMRSARNRPCGVTFAHSGHALIALFSRCSSSAGRAVSPASSTRTTSAVALSPPPRVSASSTSFWAARAGDGCSGRTSPISGSLTYSVMPSLHSRNRSPSASGTMNVAALHSGPMPSAFVNMLLNREPSFDVSTSTPAASRRASNVWSSVSCIVMPSRTMYARESPHCANTMSPPITSAPMIVVPIPPFVRSRVASAKIASCAAITPALTAASMALRAWIVPCSSQVSITFSVSSLAQCSRTTFTAMPLATSPAARPPIPSHTAKMPRSGSMKCASSLCSRTLPTLVSAAPMMDARPTASGYTCVRAACLLAAHLVTDVANRFDELARSAELRPHTSHVDIDGASSARILIAPRALEQRLAREHATAMLREVAEQLELLMRQIDPVAADLRFVAGDIDHAAVDLYHLFRAERRGAPVVLAHAAVELGRHDRHEHEVVVADREVERGQPADRDGQEDRRLDQRVVFVLLLDCLVGTGELVAGLDHHADRRVQRELGLVEPAEIEAPHRHSPTELGQQRHDRPGITGRPLRLRTDH